MVVQVVGQDLKGQVRCGRCGQICETGDEVWRTRGAGNGNPRYRAPGRWIHVNKCKIAAEVVLLAKVAQMLAFAAVVAGLLVMAGTERWIFNRATQARPLTSYSNPL